MNKQDLVSKLKQLEGLTPDERAYLTNLINTKKYGLVWEDKPEDAEELLRTHLPVLREVEERRITPPQPSTIATPPQPSPEGRESAKTENVANKQAMKPESNTTQTSLFEVDAETNNEQITNIQNEQLLEQPNLPPLGGGLGRGVSYGEGRGRAPNHILIEGDNLHALTALTFTHEGKVDVMYFDPPYNTGNKDFKYNDTFVDKEDSYRHSKWLSFMDKRLRIAKRLLSDKGLIFISIDDIEYSQLKLLLDEIFCNNIVNSITVKTSETSGVKMSHVDKKLPKIKEHLLIFSKSSDTVKLNPVKISKVDDIDKFKSYAKYYSKIIINKDDKVEDWCIIPIKDYLKQNELVLDENEIIDFKLNNAEKIVYRTNNKSLSNLQFETQTALVKSATGIDYIWWEGKQMLFLEDYINESLCDLWTDISTINLNKEICELSSFENGQKPLELIKRIEKLYPSKNFTILDFFAGSGTTLHATMQLNAEDGGNRQCILVTNNENNICEEVTYERNKRVIQGYTNAKGVPVAGLANNNLRYYRTEFVGRERSLKNKRLLVQAATQMLCVKEDIYSELTEVAGETIDKNNYRCFTDSEHYLLVIYNEEVIEELVPLIAKIESKHKIKIYVFAPGQYPYTEEFEDVLPKVELCALPDAIYKAYANVLPKKKAKDIENNEAMNPDTVGVASL